VWDEVLLNNDQIQGAFILLGSMIGVVVYGALYYLHFLFFNSTLFPILCPIAYLDGFTNGNKIGGKLIIKAIRARNE